MERVFWLLLDRDGAVVKTMMEEFQRSHRLRLPENQRRLVPVLQNPEADRTGTGSNRLLCGSPSWPRFW